MESWKKETENQTRRNKRKRKQNKKGFRRKEKDENREKKFTFQLKKNQKFLTLSLGKEGPVTDFLIMNAAAALFLIENFDFKKSTEIIREAIKNGSVKKLVGEYIKLSNSFEK